MTEGRLKADGKNKEGDYMGQRLLSTAYITIRVSLSLGGPLAMMQSPRVFWSLMSPIIDWVVWEPNESIKAHASCPVVMTHTLSH